MQWPRAARQSILLVRQLEPRGAFAAGGRNSTLCLPVGREPPSPEAPWGGCWAPGRPVPEVALQR